MEYPVILQFTAQVADGSIWLYEKPVSLRQPPTPGHFLIGYGVPKIFPPVYGLDNVMRRVIDAESDIRVKMQGFESTTETIEEVDARFPGWNRLVTPIQKTRAELQKQDPLDELFNPGM